MEKIPRIEKNAYHWKIPKGHKCSEKCDQVKLFEYLSKKKN